jgi:NADH-quinone oxidoreductase subunit M
MPTQTPDLTTTATTASHVLSLLCALPLFATFVVLFTPRQSVRFIRDFTVFSMAATFLWSLRLLTGDYGTAALQFTERYELVPQYGITFSTGVDGLSLWLVLLTTFVTPLATYMSWTHIRTKVKEYAMSLLILEAAILGGFVTLDLFVFYVFWELTLVPMLLIIGVWGAEQRFRAAVKFFLYTLVGSLMMLVAIVYLVQQYREQTGHYSFELRELKLLLLPTSTQLWLFSAFALAFAIKVPLVPLHTWLPEAYAQAPTGGTVMLSAVMVKLATYGFLRFAMPLFPSGSHRASSTLVMLAVVGIIYGAYCAWAQKDVKKLVAYSSVSHLGFVMLGIYTVSSDGLRGSLLQMVNHGISTGALFLLVGALYERRNTHNLDDFGGLAKVMPNYALVFVIVAMSSIGLPTTNGFVGEFMVLAGAFVSETLGPNGPLSAVLAATGIVLAAVYMLHAVLKLLWGPITHAANARLADLSPRECVVFVPLVALIFYIGLFPNHLLKPMAASVDRFAVEYMAKLRAGDQNPDSRGLLEEDVGARMLGAAAAPSDSNARPL